MRPTLLPAVFLSALALAGCAELRAPRTVQPVPLELLPAGQDPVRSAIAMAAADFANEGAGLQGHPVETARAVARLEWLTALASTDPRFRALPVGLVMLLQGSVVETRQALGITADAPPARVTASLTAIARALEAGRTPDFPPDLFPAGAERSQQRLRAPDPFPQAGIATGQLAEVTADIDRAGGWNPGAGDPRL
jgi:hypothetical protein